MQFSTSNIIQALAFCLSVASATPTAPVQARTPAAEWAILANGTHSDAVESTLSKRTIGGIEICTDANWLGECGYAVQPLNECIHLTAPWYHTISSFGPDQGFACDLYSDTNCVIKIYSGMVYPGSGNLVNQGINDEIGSFLCYE